MKLLSHIDTQFKQTITTLDLRIIVLDYLKLFSKETSKENISYNDFSTEY